MNRLFGANAIGRLDGDLSLPGTSFFSIRVSSPVLRFIARTLMSLLPALET